ncbi:MAG: DNA alkylation repair protein [Gemmataceae bacterium]|nr:DNA alkylation repair protein [Gemmataceae bacterium]
MTAADLTAKLEAMADPERAKAVARFFQCGPGEYGEGDQFRGIPVPIVRAAIRRFRSLPLPEIDKVLQSPWHEDRLASLSLLAHQFERGDEATRKSIYALYVQRFDRTSNWDLVDTSAPRIVGGWLADRDRGVLTKWAKSPRLWTRRVAVLATLFFIRQRDFDDLLRLAAMLLGDRANGTGETRTIHARKRLAGSRRRP